VAPYSGGAGHLQLPNPVRSCTVAEEVLIQTSDGASLWTIVEGDGPAVLLCHGGPGLWDYLGPNAGAQGARLYPSKELLDLCDQCEVPALLIHGSHDPRPEVGAVEVADHLPNSRFALIENSGRLPWVEQPDVTTHLIKDFLARTHPPP
jgi:hypothetical protein